MKFYPANSLGPPPPAAAEVIENQAFWRRVIQEEVRPVLSVAARPEVLRPEFEQRLMQSGGLKTPPPPQFKLLALLYSGALNGWGAALQREGLWTEAGSVFALAVELNPDNFPAHVNLLCSSNRLAHQKITVLPRPPLQEQLDTFRDLNQVLADNGPFEDPSYCYLMGMEFSAQDWFGRRPRNSSASTRWRRASWSRACSSAISTPAA